MLFSIYLHIILSALTVPLMAPLVPFIHGPLVIYTFQTLKSTSISDLFRLNPNPFWFGNMVCKKNTLLSFHHLAEAPHDNHRSLSGKSWNRVSPIISSLKFDQWVSSFYIFLPLLSPKVTHSIIALKILTRPKTTTIRTLSWNQSANDQKTNGVTERP